MIAEKEAEIITHTEVETGSVQTPGLDFSRLRLKLMALHADAAALREEGSDGNDPKYQDKVLAVANMIATVPGAADAVFTLPIKVSK